MILLLDKIPTDENEAKPDQLVKLGSDTAAEPRVVIQLSPLGLG